MRIRHPSMRCITSHELKKLRKRTLEAATARHGTQCPCCGQRCKIYKRRLNHQMARFLIWLVRLYKQRETWIHVSQFPLIQNTRGGGDYGKLIYWCLIKQRENAKPYYKTASGYWRPTIKGIAFVYKRVKVPEAIFVYDGFPQTFTGNRIDIVQALNGVYDYTELIAE